jgi:hypothetical protein
MADVKDVLGNITKIELSHLVVPNEGFISWKGVDGHGKWHNSKTSTIRHGVLLHGSRKIGKKCIFYVKMLKRRSLNAS